MAEREQPVPTICVCVIATPIGENSCIARTSGPDQPVCDPCEREGHPQLAGFQPRIKRDL